MYKNSDSGIFYVATSIKTIKITMFSISYPQHIAFLGFVFLFFQFYISPLSSGLLKTYNGI